MAKEYDLVLLGGGTGGYVTAARAARFGLKTAIVEKEKLGGTCLHKGCIPTKALLKSAEVFQQVKNAKQFGVEVKETQFHLNQAIERKNQIINTLHNGVKSLVQSAEIDVYQGYGRILGPSIFSPMAGSISVEYQDGRENDILVPKNVIIATGSAPNTLPGLEIDGEKVITSDHALTLNELPTSIMIVGAGVIGVEWASFFQDVGVEVTLIEAEEQILPHMDQDISSEMSKLLTKRGIQVLTNTAVDPNTLRKQDQVEVETTNGKKIKTDLMLVAVGRKANTQNIGLENTDIRTSSNGFIEVNKYFQTKESHIYAIGDVNGGKQLAHAATYEGNIAVEHISGNYPSLLKETAIPSCVYGKIEIATIGLSESDAKLQGKTVEISKTSFQAIGKAHVNGDVSGFAKIILDKNNDDVLGVHLIGKNVTELIGQASLIQYFDGSGIETSEAVYPHPSLSEIIGEVALAAEGRKIHG